MGFGLIFLPRDFSGLSSELEFESKIEKISNFSKIQKNMFPTKNCFFNIFFKLNKTRSSMWR